MTKEQRDEVGANTIRIAFILLTIVFVLSLFAFIFLLNRTQDLAQSTAQLGKINNSLITANTIRDRQDKENSIRRCRRNLEGVRLIFKPFFPKPPLTNEQTYRINLFNSRVNELKRGCSKNFAN